MAEFKNDKDVKEEVSDLDEDLLKFLDETDDVAEYIEKHYPNSVQSIMAGLPEDICMSDFFKFDSDKDVKKDTDEDSKNGSKKDAVSDVGKATTSRKKKVKVGTVSTKKSKASDKKVSPKKDQNSTKSSLRGFSRRY